MNTTAPRNANAGTSTLSYADRKKRPMLYRMLYVNSKFRIYAEPTRGLRHEDITDETVYVKTCEAYATSLDGSKDIILYPNDLIVRV